METRDLTIFESGTQFEIEEMVVEEPATLVIFRKYKDFDDVIALFPEEVADGNAAHCSSYQHLGQHGAANPMHVIQTTKLATPDEYKALAEELTQRGYKLKVINRHLRRHYLYRKDEIANWK